MPSSVPDFSFIKYVISMSIKWLEFSSTELYIHYKIAGGHKSCENLLLFSFPSLYFFVAILLRA